LVATSTEHDRDYVIIARQAAHDIEFRELSALLSAAFTKIHRPVGQKRPDESRRRDVTR
jgi:RNase P protein component